ncbi:hypothetical protein EON68_00810, partial [archaeon]
MSDSGSLLLTCKVGGAVSTPAAVAPGAGVLSIATLVTGVDAASPTLRTAGLRIFTDVQGNTVYGDFRVMLWGATTAPIHIPAASPAAGVSALRDALLALRDPVTGAALIPSVSVSTDALQNAAGGYTWRITFDDAHNGGNVPQLQVPYACVSGADVVLGGTRACAALTSAADAALAQNTVLVATEQEGNQVDGTFTLTVEGHTTAPIAYNAPAELVQQKLAALPTVGDVRVSRGLPAGVADESVNGERRYTWLITFVSNTEVWQADNALDWPSGFSQAWGRNVGFGNPLVGCGTTMLRDAAPGLTSVRCDVSIAQNGSDPVSGYFTLCLNTTASGGVLTGEPYVRASSCTRALRHDAKANRADAPNAPESTIEAAVEELLNVGDVSVSRSPTTAGAAFSGAYTWDITFLHEKPGAAWCRDAGDVSTCAAMGDVPLLTLRAASAPTAPLSGTSSTLVSEVAKGNVAAGELQLVFNAPWGDAYASPARAIDATPAALRSALLSGSIASSVAGGPLTTPITNVLVSRNETTKFRTFQWRVTFTDVRVYEPWGAGNHAPLGINTTLLSQPNVARAGLSAAAAILQPGSAGLGGAFTLDLVGSEEGAQRVAWDEAPERLALLLGELSSVERVHITRAITGSGWGAQHTQSAAGGWRYRIAFVRVAGQVDGDTFPPGTGIVSPLQATYAPLVGTNARVVVMRDTPGSAPLSGSFTLGVASAHTRALDFNAAHTDVEAEVSALSTVGTVAVRKFSTAHNVLG